MMRYDDPSEENKNRVQRLWSWLLNEDRLFAYRTGSMLVAESMLITAFAIASGFFEANVWLTIFIGISGEAVSLVWLWVAWLQISGTMRRVEGELDRRVRERRAIGFKRTEVTFRAFRMRFPESNRALGVYLPAFFAALWLIMSVAGIAQSIATRPSYRGVPSLVTIIYPPNGIANVPSNSALNCSHHGGSVRSSEKHQSNTGQIGCVTVNTEGTAHFGAWRWIITAIGVLILLRSGYIFLNLKTEKLLDGLATLASGVVLTIAPQISIPVHAQLKFALKLSPKVEAKFEKTIEVKVEHKVEYQMKRSGLINPIPTASGLINGFHPGGYKFGCHGPKYPPVIRGLTKVIENVQKSGLTPIVLAVGGTDREPLSPTLQVQFGGNSGLARARANAVEQCIKRASGTKHAKPSTAPEFFALITGPSYTPSRGARKRGSAAARAEDRGVTVLVLAAKQEKPVNTAR